MAPGDDLPPGLANAFAVCYRLLEPVRTSWMEDRDRRYSTAAEFEAALRAAAEVAGRLPSLATAQRASTLTGQVAP